MGCTKHKTENRYDTNTGINRHKYGHQPARNTNKGTLSVWMKTGLLKSDIDRAEIQNIVFVRTMRWRKWWWWLCCFVVVADVGYDVGDDDDNNENAEIDVGIEDPIALLLCWVKVAFDRFGMSISLPFLTIISPSSSSASSFIMALHHHNHHIITNGN